MAPQHWIEACRLEELPPGGRKLVKINNIEVALFNLKGVIYAIKNRCPHRSGPLIRGFTDSAGGAKSLSRGGHFNFPSLSSNPPARPAIPPIKLPKVMFFLCLCSI